MTDQHDDSGAAAPPMDPQQQAEAEFIDQTVREAAAFVALFIHPDRFADEHGEANRQQLLAKVIAEVTQQHTFFPLLEDMLDGDKRELHPWVGFALEQTLPGQPPRILHRHRVPKTLLALPNHKVMPLNAMIALATFMGFLVTPAMRALLSVHGIEIVFENADGPVVPPRPAEAPAPKLIV